MLSLQKHLSILHLIIYLCFCMMFAFHNYIWGNLTSCPMFYNFGLFNFNIVYLNSYSSLCITFKYFPPQLSQFYNTKNLTTEFRLQEQLWPQIPSSQLTFTEPTKPHNNPLMWVWEARRVIDMRKVDRMTFLDRLQSSLKSNWSVTWRSRIAYLIST